MIPEGRADRVVNGVMSFREGVEIELSNRTHVSPRAPMVFVAVELLAVAGRELFGEPFELADQLRLQHVFCAT